MKTPIVSVVIPAYNCEKTINLTIEAILKQDYLPSQIIVVDDGSTDQTAQIVKSFHEIQYFYQTNAGPAAARNKGSKNATGEIIFFTDADCIPRKDWIRQSITHFNNTEVAVVMGSYGIANQENILARCIQKEIEYRHNMLMPLFPKAFGSYNFAIRKKIFKEVHGFNAHYRRASGEDNDLSYKILKAGYKIYFEKRSIVDHFHATKLSKYLKEQFRHGFWRAKMYFDHPEMIRGDDYTFWKDILEVCVVITILFLIALLKFAWSIFLFLLFYLWVALFLLELFTAILFIKKICEITYFSFVMFLRSFSRTFGFLAGGIAFLTSRKE